MERNSRKVYVGKVVSAKCDKTITVMVNQSYAILFHIAASFRALLIFRSFSFVKKDTLDDIYPGLKRGVYMPLTRLSEGGEKGTPHRKGIFLPYTRRNIRYDGE